MAIINSKLLVYQRVSSINPIKVTIKSHCLPEGIVVFFLVNSGHPQHSHSIGQAATETP